MRKLSGLIIVGLLGTAGCAEPPPPAPPPPPDVEIAEVLQRDVPVYSEAIGESRGSLEVDVRARVAGVLQTVDFQEGSHVRSGQLLYTIDPREFQAVVEQAKGDLARAIAEQARFVQDVARYKPLVDQNAIPRQTYETAVAQAEAAKAAVEAARATVARAELDVEYTKVYATTDGIIGKTEVNPGNLVGRGESTLLTRISKVDPIHVRFSIAEREYLALMRRFGPGDGRQREQAVFDLILADGSLHPHKGRLAFADRLVDPSTGTLLVEVAYPNPERIIRPGQYGRVRIAVETRIGAILVPQKAVQELQATYTVAVVRADNTVDMRQVVPGPRVGNLWVIDTGLNPGDRVVVEGLQKVRPGVTVNPTVVTIDEAPAAGTAGGN
ncbi:MAG TPA: efflux RND transporter periplasmic adaptor subunit [Vicinamibacterales bacterium]|nr:efflux RND transporter periplasmic adaptor subunit [Vicinamibacterales bacterium]